MGKGEIIGYAVISEDTVMHNNSFECAAWYENILVRKGKYPIVSDGRGDFYIHYDGEIVSDYFGSLFCGVPIGTYDCEKNRGKKATYTAHLYGFMIARCILENEGHCFGGSADETFVLEDGYEAVWEEYEWDGEKKKSPSILKTKGE